MTPIWKESQVSALVVSPRAVRINWIARATIIIGIQCAQTLLANVIISDSFVPSSNCSYCGIIDVASRWSDLKHTFSSILIENVVVDFYCTKLYSKIKQQNIFPPSYLDYAFHWFNWFFNLRCQIWNHSWKFWWITTKTEHTTWTSLATRNVLTSADQPKSCFKKHCGLPSSWGLMNSSIQQYTLQRQVC